MKANISGRERQLPGYHSYSTRESAGCMIQSGVMRLGDEPAGSELAMGLLESPSRCGHTKTMRSSIAYQRSFSSVAWPANVVVKEGDEAMERTGTRGRGIYHLRLRGRWSHLGIYTIPITRVSCLIHHGRAGCSIVALGSRSRNVPPPPALPPLLSDQMSSHFPTAKE